MEFASKAFSIGDWVSNGTRLGKGAFATVYLAQHKYTKEKVAVKVIDIYRLSKDDEKLKKHLESEIEISGSLQHPNIVEQKEFRWGSEYLYLVLQYCEGGDFSKYLKEAGRLPESLARHFLCELAEGLKFLHSKNIIHRDLKPQNLLLTSRDPRNAHLKIADFGFARIIAPQSVAETYCGSPLYMAPEVLRGKKYDAKADLWSVGVIFYEMLTGRPPFNVRTHVQLMTEMEKPHEVQLPPDLNVSSNCLDLLRKLLQKDSSKRIEWEAFFRHPFLGNNTIPTELNGFEGSGGERREIHTSLGSSKDAPGTPTRSRSSSREYPFLVSRSPSSSTSLASPTSSYERERWSMSPRKPKTYPYKESTENIIAVRDAAPSVKLAAPLHERANKLSEDSFEFINSQSSSSEYSQLSVEEKLIIEDVERLYKQSVVIAELADSRVEMSPVEALALYIKLLDILKHILTNNHILQSKSLSSSPKLSHILDMIKEKFSMYLTRAEYWKRNLKLIESGPNAEQLIYQSALHMGREGAVSEVLEDYSKAYTMYQNGLLLLQQLQYDATDQNDCDILRDYVEAFSKRRREVKKKV
eukprot:CAMPEP_0174276428 /NCGR_PEP_ID=MMETSP0439-20130205/60378_1 /TAXON_ID=0 /ORGANISM="Stereomyxa ramosa, Strain Chinc5" /LENGTH=582 /DNA_ID=CAMNT_0015368651 /DNA_START=819 /DNA_END=2567 /DNA_ORIENTATION=+